jgi:zinc transport system substrate-binding protein
MVLILSLSLTTASCGAGSGGSSSGGADVVASLYPLAFAAETIGGPAFEVANLTPPGTEPHDVELSVSDVESIRSADVVLYLGSGFQPAVERAIEGADGEAIDLLAGHALEGEEGVDPHVWLDPLRYAEIAKQIGQVLDRQPAAQQLEVKLRDLHEEFERGLSGCERREIVTSHDAFGYLAERYDLEQIAISGLSPEAEPAPQEFERVVAEVRASGATTVFFETLVSPRIAETVAREAGVDTATLDPLEGLTEEDIAGGADYFSVMRRNLDALRKALGCR